MKKYILYTINAIGCGVAISVYPKIIELGLGAFSALVISVGFSLLITYFIEWCLLIIPMKSRFMRKIIDPRSIFEGDWIIEIISLPQRPYSYGKIVYNHETKEYDFWGYAFDKNYNKVAQWNSIDLIIDLKRNQIRYYYESHIYSQDKKLTGHGEITFKIKSNRKIIGADGFFVDGGDFPQASDYIVEQFTRANVKKYINKKEIDNSEDIRLLLLKYYKERQQASDKCTP